eukprot:11471496-Alexandrium_andersonii.AAC.1
MTGHLIVASVPDKISRAVEILEELLTSIAPIGERGVMRPDDSVPTRMLRIAGLFREYGGSSLLSKP